ncbi:MAG: BREX-2 system adenine-specific DNA-methyltransferase PglX [Polyangiaceae bacterium]|nr:BREX-2 system adenine-specific DNA-methyltransferase PglX [Polyangiaceae bacterium]
MKPADRNRLTAALAQHVAAIAADLRQKLRGLAEGSAAVRARAEQLHQDERVGEDFDVWTDVLSRRAAVLWVLKTVYVRVLEDRGLLRPGRLLDIEAQQLFEKLAPHLGETAFLRWIFKDLASDATAGRGVGLPELFSPQPAELALPADALSRALIAFWRAQDPDTHAQWSFADETFEGELMGDLYQELDPVVKDRFALCQTPDFVRAFILDRTLTPAIETFGADTVRLLDPSCGSGHFLIDGLKRIVAATALQHPDWSRLAVVRRSMERVVGIDLNDYACGLARARLLMTAADLADVSTLQGAAQFHPHVYWGDGLEQVERDDKKAVQTDLFAKTEEKPRATFTRSDVRIALRRVFAAKFHAVVANPPYITEKDPAKKDYHREKVGKTQRYVSAYREYSLASPFTERCFQLAETNGYVGLITSNNFMKREFGKPLVQNLFAGKDLRLVVDSSQAAIPHHGTPTVMVFARNCAPNPQQGVRAVMGKRGENRDWEDPPRGKVWSGIANGWNQPGFETEYVSVADLPRATLCKHPWSLGGGGAAELREQLEQFAATPLGDVAESIGFAAITGADEVFVQPPGVFERRAVEHSRPFTTGEAVRDWANAAIDRTAWPYDKDAELLPAAEAVDVLRFFWAYRVLLRNRRVFSRPIEERGIAWWAVKRGVPRPFPDASINRIAFVATHNHFVVDRGGAVFNRHAPVIKLPAGSTEEDHLALLGLLNSSTACFWMKQVFHCKGIRGEGGGLTVADWEQFFEFDATKIKLFPIAGHSERTLPYATRMDALARGRAARSCNATLVDESWRTAAALRTALDARHTADTTDLLAMVGLQEELDWLCYDLYGLDSATDVVPVDKVEPMPPTWLPWNLALAERDAANCATVARGEEADEQPTAWFERHRWQPLAALPAEASAALKKRVAARRVRTEATPALALIETANFKRRWYRPDHEAEEKEALEAWLADRVESVTKERGRPMALDQIVAALQDDSRVLAVAEVLTGRRDANLGQLVADALLGDAVPSHPFHVYKPAGLVKRAAWERTWADQRREDAGEKVTPEVPPSYGSGDFLRTEYWQLRGKLDVPKERFIAFTEVPGRAGAETLYGWAGWTPKERLKVLLTIDEGLEDAGIALADRIGLLDSAWRLVPDVAREDAAAAARLKAELQALLGPEGPSKELLEDWQKRFPPPKTKAAKAAKKKSKKIDDDEGEADA